MSFRFITIKSIGSVKVRVLESSIDFPVWNNDIQSICQDKRIWKLVSGEEEIIRMPKRPEGPQPLRQQYVSEEWNIYKWDREDYDRQREKINVARQLVTQSISVEIRNNISEAIKTRVILADEPAPIFNYIKSNYAPTETRAILTALRRMHQATFQNAGNNVTAFASRLRMLQTEIIVAGHDCSNAFMVSKLQVGLSKEYQDFMFTTIKSATEVPQFDSLIPVLQSIENRLPKQSRYK